MRARIMQAIVSVIALITFVFVGARMVWDFQAWECTCSHVECEECNSIYADAYDDAWCEFTNLFNSYTYKRSSNGRSMINGKFVAMPKGE